MPENNVPAFLVAPAAVVALAIACRTSGLGKGELLKGGLIVATGYLMFALIRSGFGLV